MKLLVAALTLAAFPWSEARSQVSIDVSKIACQQFATYKITDPKNIALWLHGFFKGKKNDTLVDSQKLIAETDKLVEYCLRNSSVLVMQAAEKMFGADN
jgi:hypothetical protein